MDKVLFFIASPNVTFSGHFKERKRTELFLPAGVYMLTERNLAVFWGSDMLFVDTHTGTEWVASFTDIVFITSSTSYHIHNVSSTARHVGVNLESFPVEVVRRSLGDVLTSPAS
jgi:hypothetical protein